MTEPLKRLYRVQSNAEIKRIFGSFSFSNNRDGSIDIARAWVNDNIVPCLLVKGRKGRDIKTQCHRLAKEPFERAYQEVADRGLSHLIKTWDGLWVPRHMTWQLSRPLSSHSWGIAFDINAQWNGYGGGTSPENLALARIFIKYGMDWGGFWKVRDSMHYQLVDPNAYKKLDELMAAPPKLILAVKRKGGVLSYHEVQSADHGNKTFDVAIEEIAALLNQPVPASAGGFKATSLDNALDLLQWNIYDRGDEPAEGSIPRRFYAFVQANSK